MADKTLTAVNSVFLLSIRGLYPVPQRLQGYSADAAFDTDAAEPVETMVGVDGKMSAGYTPFLTQQTITLNPDSESNLMFENWLAAMKAQGEILYADGIVILPSVQRKYVQRKGVLSSVVAIPGTRRVLQARPYRITWESIDPSPV